jgi:hypothetical protein
MCKHALNMLRVVAHLGVAGFITMNDYTEGGEQFIS